MITKKYLPIFAYAGLVVLIFFLFFGPYIRFGGEYELVYCTVTDIETVNKNTKNSYAAMETEDGRKILLAKSVNDYVSREVEVYIRTDGGKAYRKNFELMSSTSVIGFALIFFGILCPVILLIVKKAAYKKG